jgi:Domain of unknown function (DUF4845)
MDTRKGQRGVGLVALIMVMFVLVVVGIFSMKLIPPYMEFLKAQNAIEAIAADRSKTSSVAEVRKAFDARATIDDISSIKGSDLEISKDGSGVVIGFTYRKEVPLGASLGLYVDFVGTSRQ